MNLTTCFPGVARLGVSGSFFKTRYGDHGTVKSHRGMVALTCSAARGDGPMRSRCAAARRLRSALATYRESRWCSMPTESCIIVQQDFYCRCTECGAGL